jgi:hypothetical protein
VALALIQDRMKRCGQAVEVICDHSYGSRIKGLELKENRFGLTYKPKSEIVVSNMYGKYMSQVLATLQLGQSKLTSPRGA